MAFPILAATVGGGLLPAQQPGTEMLRWRNLPELPRVSSGQFAGVSGGALLVAGGSYFPTPLFDGGQKTWHDAVFVLEPGHAAWKTLKLPRPLAYGGSVTIGDGLILIGGGDASRNYATVFRLRWLGGRLEESRLPDLPGPAANMSAALLGTTIYVAGGQDSTTATSALRNFWALDLERPGAQWQSLDPWPGAARIFPVLAAQDGAVYLFSGAELYPGSGGKAARRYLTDGYRFQPGKGWSKLADVPRPMVAAPVAAIGQSHILVMGGDDGENATRIWELKDQHPGFRPDALAYHTITRTWTLAGTLPKSLVTTTAVRWNNDIVIPAGEDRPGHRSSAVLAGTVEQPQKGFEWIDYAVLGVYLLAIGGLGASLLGRNRSTGAFFLGGRRIPWWAAGLSIYGTQLSSITFMAMPAKSYATDWTYVLVNVCILLVAPAIVFFYMPFFHRLKITTAYEYLERRFNMAVRLFTSALFVMFQLGRLAIVMYLPAIALATVSQMNVYWCILLMGGMAIVYTMLGGIEAVIWTDVAQSIILLGGALLCLALAVQGAEAGWSPAIDAAVRDSKFQVFDWSWNYTTATVWVMMLGNLASVLATYTTDQTVIQKYLTTADERKSAQSIWMNAALTIPSTLIFFGMGTALYVYYQSQPGKLDPSLPTDAILPWFMVQNLPAGVAGLVLAALFAAAQSTISSSMHSMATALMVDFYRPFRGSGTDREQLRLARVLIVLLGATGTVVAMLMATYNIQSLFDAFLGLLSLLGGTLAGVFALGIFTRRANGSGVLLGGLGSAAVVLAVRSYTPAHFMLYATAGLVSCMVLGYACSFLLPSAKRDLAGLTVFTR